MNASHARRRWFQLHLSTALLISLTAAIWIGLNLRHAHINYPDTMVSHGRENDTSLGFPFGAAFFSSSLSNSNGAIMNCSDDCELISYHTPDGGYMVFTKKVILNGLIGVFLLLIEYALMEHVVRCRMRGVA